MHPPQSTSGSFPLLRMKHLPSSTWLLMSPSFWGPSFTPCISILLYPTSKQVLLAVLQTDLLWAYLPVVSTTTIWVKATVMSPVVNWAASWLVSLLPLLPLSTTFPQSILWKANYVSSQLKILQWLSIALKKRSVSPNPPGASSCISS